MNNLSLSKLLKNYLPAIEKELKRAVSLVDEPGLEQLHAMMAYHMGWEGEGAGLKAAGKRIRPSLVLLTTQAAGSVWERALPAAAAIELVHNFSLLHDDIEDNSPLRRGRPTAWVKWGVPQAINTGDAMFTLAHLTLLQLNETTTPSITLDAAQILQQTCLSLTQGQFLDISYEKRDILTIGEYWSMINGKTAALLAACTELGAIVAEVDDDTRSYFKIFGLNLGLAFQILDDILGIWGDSRKIGKSVDSDLVEGKKSLPVLFGLAKNGEFATRWAKGPVTLKEVPKLADQLEAEGARDYAQKEAEKLTNLALQALENAKPKDEAGNAMLELANQLLKRQA